MPTEINKIIQEPILLLNNGDRFAAFNHNYLSFEAIDPLANFFNPDYLDQILSEFPDLAQGKSVKPFQV